MLFRSTYNYDIQFPENQRVTIITGPNGYGKTTFLKIINNLLTCNFWFFYLLKFKEIQIFFRNGMNISIQKKRIEAEDNNREDRTPASLKEKVFFRLNANESDEAYIEEFSLSYSDILRLRRQLLHFFASYECTCHEEQERQKQIGRAHV